MKSLTVKVSTSTEMDAVHAATQDLLNKPFHRSVSLDSDKTMVETLTLIISPHREDRDTTPPRQMDSPTEDLEMDLSIDTSDFIRPSLLHPFWTPTPKPIEAPVVPRQPLLQPCTGISKPKLAIRLRGKRHGTCGKISIPAVHEMVESGLATANVGKGSSKAVGL